MNCNCTGANQQISRILNDTFNFLVQNQFCKIHKIQHTGRFGYALLIALISGEEIGIPKSEEKRIFDTLISNIAIDDKGPYLKPGNRNRRNYSSDAIDIGIAIDVMSLFMEKNTITETEFSQVKNLVDKKLVQLINVSNIHNQRLWATLGLAHFSNNVLLSESDKEYYKSVSVKSIDKFLKTLGRDGFSPYFEKDASLNGHSPYYHSRCLAFILHSFELLGIKPNKTQQICIKRAYMYMMRSSNLDGTRNVSIDSKRYYFLGEGDYFSLVFDLYVAQHPILQDLKVQDLAKNTHTLTSLLMEKMTFNVQGDLRFNEVGSPGWQCNYMGISYLAWFARIKFHQCADEEKGRLKVSNIDPILSSASLFTISYGAKYKYHFVANKSPINFHTGGISSGLILQNSRASAFNLSEKVMAQYSHYQFTWKIRILLSRLVKKDLKWIGLFMSEFLFLSKSRIKTFMLVKSTISYIGCFFRSSTCFLTKVEVTQINSDSLSHTLSFSTLDGNNVMNFGTRKIRAVSSGLEIVDTLHLEYIKAIGLRRFKLNSIVQGIPQIFKIKGITAGDTYEFLSEVGVHKIHFV
jgi:hypothetical protein